MSCNAFGFVNMTTEKRDLSHKLSKHPKTFEKEYRTIVLVDVKVGFEGKVIETKLSDPKRYTSFNQFALMRAKKNNYPVKKENGVAIEYWLKEVPINFSVSPMGTQIEPLQTQSKK